MSSTLPVSSKSYTQRKYRSRSCRLSQALLSSEYSPLFICTTSNKIRISIHLGKGHVCIVSRVVNKFYACAYNLRRGTNALIHSGNWHFLVGSGRYAGHSNWEQTRSTAKICQIHLQNHWRFIIKFYAVLWQHELLWCVQWSHIYEGPSVMIYFSA